MNLLCFFGLHSKDITSKWTPSIHAEVVTEFRHTCTCSRCSKILGDIHLVWDGENMVRVEGAVMVYEVDWRKVTYQERGSYGASPPVRCPFRGELSRLERLAYRIKYGFSPNWAESTQCYNYEGHWHFEGQRFHEMPYQRRRWPVSADEVARYAAD